MNISPLLNLQVEWGSRLARSIDKYRDWAEKVRKIRDAKEPEVRKRSPVTLSREEITGVDQAIETIVRLRQQIQSLSSQVENLQKENKQLKTQVVKCRQEKEYNERLRG